jgi:hypothetical protein
MSRDLAIFLAYGYGYAFILGMIVGVALTGLVSTIFQSRAAKIKFGLMSRRRNN